VRREISAGGTACRAESAREGNGGRALAVRADYLGYSQRVLGITEGFKESVDALEA
jgi:hypothetical protein